MLKGLFNYVYYNSVIFVIRENVGHLWKWTHVIYYSNEISLLERIRSIDGNTREKILAERIVVRDFFEDSLITNQINAVPGSLEEGYWEG